MKESGRSGHTITFRLIAQGVPKDAVYTLISWPVTQKTPSASMNGVTLDANGIAICAGVPGRCSGNKPNDPIDLVTNPVPGEPLRLGLVSDDGTTKVFGRTVPIPVRGQDRGCTLDATLLSPRGELIVIEGSGFPANTDAVMTSNSQREQQSTQEKIDANGKHLSAAMPFTNDATHGILEMNLKSPQCSPSVSIPWGR